MDDAFLITFLLTEVGVNRGERVPIVQHTMFWHQRVYYFMFAAFAWENRIFSCDVHFSYHGPISCPRAKIARLDSYSRVHKPDEDIHRGISYQIHLAIK